MIQTRNATVKPSGVPPTKWKHSVFLQKKKKDYPCRQTPLKARSYTIQILKEDLTACSTGGSQ